MTCPTKNMMHRRRVTALAKFFIDKNIYIHKGASVELFVHPTEVQIIQTKALEVVFEGTWKNDADTINLDSDISTVGHIIQNICSKLKETVSVPMSGYTTIVTADPEEELRFTDLSVLDAFSLKLRDDVVYMKTIASHDIRSNLNAICIQSSDARVSVGQVKSFCDQLVNRVKTKMIVG